MTNPLRVRTLDHVTIMVRDLERSRRFYVDVLGMEEVPRPAFSFAGSWFRAGATLVHLVLKNDRTGTVASQGMETPRSTRSDHFAFAVEDGVQAADWLKTQGVPLVDGPKERPDGAMQVFVADPDGYLVELCSPPPRTPERVGVAT